jgi:exosortase/archaeosortase family protein
MLLFLAKFFAIYFFLTALVELADLSFLTQPIAGLAAQPFGFTAEGSRILVDGKGFLVTNACTGLSSAAILAALVFGLKRPPIGKKLGVFAIGLAALLLLNIPRVMLVLFAAGHGLNADEVHVYTWFLMSGAILLLWYYGNKKIAKVKDFGEMI